MIAIRDLGRCHYLHVWPAMRHFTQTRDQHSTDAIWLVEHEPIYSQGQRGKLSDLLEHNDIPIVFSDRGGQITYHGPGQITAYVLLNLARYELNLRALVGCLEQAVIGVLENYGLKAYSRQEAPGVYIDDAKIASLGLRIKRGYSYHGLSFNIDMDLTPFEAIHPCGYQQLRMTQLANFVEIPNLASIKQQLVQHLLQHITA